MKLAIQIAILRNGVCSKEIHEEAIIGGSDGNVIKLLPTRELVNATDVDYMRPVVVNGRGKVVQSI